MPKTWTTAEERAPVKEHVIERLWKGESLRQIIRKYKGVTMPSRQLIYDWLNPNHENHDSLFLDQYTQAREDQADLHADIIQEIARKVMKGKVDPAAGRVAIDALKWTAGKKKPKKYGDKIDIAHSGETSNQVHIFHIPDNGRDKLKPGPDPKANGREEN